MPFSTSGHAATVLQPSQPSKMESRGSSRLLEEPLPPSSTKQGLFSTGDPAVTTQTPPTSERKRVDKRSLDYILRSGLAGGLAGCAVSGTATCMIRRPQADKFTGQNGCRTARSSQDPFPSLESTVCKIYWKLAGSVYCDEGHQ